MNVPPGASAGVPAPIGRPIEEDDSPDENEPVWSHTLAIGRFGRNRSLVSEVFLEHLKPRHHAPYALLNLLDMTAKIDTLTANVAALESYRQQGRSTLDTPMHDDIPKAPTTMAL